MSKILLPNISAIVNRTAYICLSDGKYKYMCNIYVPNDTSINIMNNALYVNKFKILNIKNTNTNENHKYIFMYIFDNKNKNIKLIDKIIKMPINEMVFNKLVVFPIMNCAYYNSYDGYV